MPKTQPVGIGMTPCKTALGNLIRDRRLKLNLSQVRLAKLTRLTQGHVSALEVGTIKSLNNRQTKQLAKALQCDIEVMRKCVPTRSPRKARTPFWRFISKKRNELGLSKKELAHKMGYEVESWYRFERKNHKKTSLGFVKKLAPTLGLDVSDFARFTTKPKKQPTNRLGRMVRNRRIELGMSGEELADKLKRTRQYVSSIELGNIRLSVNGSMVDQIAEALKLDAKDLRAIKEIRRIKKVSGRGALGKFLSKKRRELGLNQTQLAAQVGKKFGLICHIETGRLVPDRLLLEQIAKALGCKIPSKLLPPPAKKIA